MSSFSQSRLAAWLQNFVSKRREQVGLYREIAEQIPLDDTGRLLDVGTGSGLQLKVIHGLKPNLELYGLDLSAAAIRVARNNLGALEVDLRQGSIESTSYDDDFFDVVTCHSSMSYWQDLSSCFDEIYRILRPGGSAVLFEPHRDIDIDQALETIRANLADESPLRRFLAVNLHRFALRRGGRVGLKLYGIDELQQIASRSKFGRHASIEGTTLQNLPIFMRISLHKLAESPAQNGLDGS
jgi:ubiquinone/menaquinone biosynthesis C-methylase UbiE